MVETYAKCLSSGRPRGLESLVVLKVLEIVDILIWIDKQMHELEYPSPNLKAFPNLLFGYSLSKTKSADRKLSMGRL